MSRALALLLVVATVASACSTTRPTTTTTTTTTFPPASTTTPALLAPVPCLSGGAPFGDRGLVAAVGVDEGDATVVAGLGFERETGCERLAVDFLSSSGAPAAELGPTGVTVEPESGIVRVILPPEVTGTGPADATVDGDLLERVFVVRRLDGTLAIDLHLTADAAVEARASLTSSPARLVVDLRPAAGQPEALSPPRRSRDLVLLSPPPGPGLYPLRITGYARPGTVAVRIRLVDAAGEAFDRSVSTQGPGDAWEEFDVRVADGPSGAVELFVGTVDDLDRPLDGVTTRLDLP